METLLITLICLASFLIRYYPRHVLKNAYSSDTYFHLYCARVLRERRLRIPSRLPGVALNQEYT